MKKRERWTSMMTLTPHSASAKLFSFVFVFSRKDKIRLKRRKNKRYLKYALPEIIWCICIMVPARYLLAIWCLMIYRISLLNNILFYHGLCVLGCLKYICSSLLQQIIFVLTNITVRQIALVFSFIQWYIYSRLRVFTINAIFPLFSNLRFTLLLLAFLFLCLFVSLSLCSSHRIRISYKCRAYDSKCLFFFSQFVRVFFLLFKYFPCSHFFIWCRCKHFIYCNRTFNFGCD